MSIGVLHTASKLASKIMMKSPNETASKIAKITKDGVTFLFSNVICEMIELNGFI